MSFNEVLKLVLEIGDSINFLWNLYLAINIALIGLLLRLNKGAGWQLKLLVTVGYLFAIGLNLRALVDCYSILAASAEELRELAKGITFMSDTLKRQLEAMSYDNRLTITWVVHGSVDLSMLGAIWSNKVWDAIRVRG